MASLAPMNVGAFTLIQPVIKLYVNPSAGYTTSLVQVRGTLTFPGGPCTVTPESFAFTFDSKPLWSTVVGQCNTATHLWDTSWSAYKVPPVARTVGNHTIALTVFGKTVSYRYVIYAAPSPRAAPSPTPTPSPSTCPVAAAIPPAGTGGFIDNFIAASMVVAVLPIVGLALFGPSRMLSFVGRRRRFLQFLGLSLLVVATLSCTSTLDANQSSPSASTAVTPSTQPTPSPSPSPSSSPSC